MKTNFASQLLERAKIDPTKIKEFQDGCNSKAMDAFKKAGGNDDSYAVAKLEGQRKNIADYKGACMKDSRAKTTEEKKAANDKCDQKTKESFVDAGGSVGDFKKELEVSQRDVVANTIKLCTGTKIECKALAKDEFEKLGGTAQEFLIAKTQIGYQTNSI